MRLDRFISERTEYSRSEIKRIAAKGGIKVNSAVVKKSDTQIDPDRDKVEVLGNELRAGFEPGLFQQVLYVAFYRGDRNEQPRGYFGVGIAGGELFKHVELALGEFAVRRAADAHKRSFVRVYMLARHSALHNFQQTVLLPVLIPERVDSDPPRA